MKVVCIGMESVFADVVFVCDVWCRNMRIGDFKGLWVSEVVACNL